MHHPNKKFGNILNIQHSSNLVRRHYPMLRPKFLIRQSSDRLYEIAFESSIPQFLRIKRNRMLIQSLKKITQLGIRRPLDFTNNQTVVPKLLFLFNS